MRKKKKKEGREGSAFYPFVCYLFFFLYRRKDRKKEKKEGKMMVSVVSQRSVQGSNYLPLLIAPSGLHFPFQSDKIRSTTHDCQSVIYAPQVPNCKSACPSPFVSGPGRVCALPPSILFFLPSNGWLNITPFDSSQGYSPLFSSSFPALPCLSKKGRLSSDPSVLL